ncbi:DUF1194 domain-containing protein [Fertoebacter nigrum]|uniref:DUF1194 domain-containing protein n=1 Tax=Fertoeibacter niger TaxID=2656921 RepID=A0A8X8GYW7_9RHOB|nr:DUF1194 domain-containing protein [Fertoeibacter niger]NUB43946.1 DUF1194 domain-containing protein [Fertoeibacter niger]
MRHLLPLLLVAAPLHAQEVDLELVLLADASGSITQSEIEFQRLGYATAITDPAVLNAIRSNLTGSIAVTYVEWAANQAIVVDWTVIDSAESAAGFAAALLPPPRLASGRNAIGAALLEGKRLIEDNSITGLRRVIDFSGDSTGNFSGPSIAEARAEVLAAGITINGLPIVCLDCSGGERSELAQDYERQIIGGPGAFVVAADGNASFAEAVRRKLILEIAGDLPPDAILPAMATPGTLLADR